MPGEDSVGMEVAVKHLAPTLMGMTVEITVRVVAVEGRKVFFEATVKDELDEVGAGTHTRFVIDKAKTFERLKAKAARFAAQVGLNADGGRSSQRRRLHVRSRGRDHAARRARGAAACAPATDRRTRLCQGAACARKISTPPG